MLWNILKFQGLEVEYFTRDTFNYRILMEKRGFMVRHWPLLMRMRWDCICIWNNITEIASVHMITGKR